MTVGTARSETGEGQTRAALGPCRPSLTRCRQPLGEAETRALVERLRRLEPDLFFDGPVRRCGWCDRYAGRPGRPCPACSSRATRLAELVDGQGLPLELAARRLEVDPATARTLLERARYAVERTVARVDYIDNGLVRDLYRQVRLRDPEMNLERLAALAGFSCGTHVARLLGLRPTSPRRHGDRTYPGRLLEAISVDNAARLVRALGHEPVQFRELGL
jgi:hypothetical protein